MVVVVLVVLLAVGRRLLCTIVLLSSTVLLQLIGQIEGVVVVVIVLVLVFEIPRRTVFVKLETKFRAAHNYRRLNSVHSVLPVHNLCRCVCSQISRIQLINCPVPLHTI